MKILHTADWHIGKTLYKQSLVPNIKLFFDWLLDTIKEKDIDLLLVSGDIFDLANPSNADKEIYYNLLHQLHILKVACVITAGNHDSPSLLEGPKKLIERLGIHIIGHGGVREDQLIHIKGEDSTAVNIIAVPYLRDSDIARPQGGLSYEERITALRDGIIAHYKSLKELADAKYPDSLNIAMGHLYIQGASLSDSERDIHIGNQAGLSVQHLDELYDYIALGHIHRPQKLNKEGNIRYSGSPIPLSFSERKDEKEVVILTLEDNKITDISSIKTPSFSPLVRIKDSLENIKTKLQAYRSPGTMSAIIEIHVTEKERDQSIILETISLAETKSPHYSIINYRITFEEQLSALSDLGLSEDIEDLKPAEVFQKRIENEALSKEDKASVLEAFDEVLSLITDKA